MADQTHADRNFYQIHQNGPKDDMGYALVATGESVLPGDAIGIDANGECFPCNGGQDEQVAGVAEIAEGGLVTTAYTAGEMVRYWKKGSGVTCAMILASGGTAVSLPGDSMVADATVPGQVIKFAFTTADIETATLEFIVGKTTEVKTEDASDDQIVLVKI